ncbi:MAG: glycosyltransferase [Elainellaceae cyanobacterium]
MKSIQSPVSQRSHLNKDIRASLSKWRNRNLYYYEDLERFYQFVVQPQSRVLEVGSGSGHLLAALDASYGLGIDKNPLAVEMSAEKFPEIDFQIAHAEDFEAKEGFDYVLLSNTVSYIDNVQQALENLRQACTPSTRLLLTFHNPTWELILKFATLIGQRMPLPPLNWLNRADVTNLLDLAGFEIVSQGKRLLFPKRAPFLSWFCNQVLAPLPLVNRLCLTEYMVARLRPEASERRSQVHQMTCSIIVPARNEAGNIKSCITRLPRMGKRTEVIFIEGHSSDNTWEEIQRVKAKYGHQWDIKAFQQTGKGKGDAVRLGFEQASGDVLIILDSDLTVRPEDMPYFFEAIASGKCEMANGCRLIYPVNKEAMPWLNRMANRFFAWLLSYLLNTKIKDS